MLSTQYEIEVISPVIMGGADSKELDPYKIRTSEIKSIMRQAFRSVAAKYINYSSEKSLKTLLEKEGEIFGSTKNKSVFKIWVEDADNLKTEKIKLLPHKSNWSKNAVNLNQTFKLKILFNKYEEEFYKSLLNLAFIFGVGNRRNRLNGNLKIKSEELDLQRDLNNIKKVCEKLFETEEVKVNEPLFPGFTLREDEKKNYVVYSLPLKENYYPKNKESFENLLKEIYTKVIHKLEKDHNYILGSASQRQGSFINLSLHKYENSKYKLFLIGFYYKNKEFNYDKWRKGIEKTIELLRDFKK